MGGGGDTGGIGRTRLPWRLIAAQVGIVVLGMVLAVAALLVLSAEGPWWLLAVLLIGVGMLVALVFLEGRKVEWARALRVEDFDGSHPPPENHAARVRQLTESRRRIVDAFEIERARIERDLHDGAQQFLVAAAMKVGEAALALDAVTAGHPDDRAARAAADLLGQAQDDTDAALAALRETVAGVHSRLLSEQGLDPALRELAARFSRPDREVVLRIPHPLPELPHGVAAAAWFFVAEALTNATKYAPGAPVSVVVVADSSLHASVVDEGPGGAVITPGRGLAGMRERLSAFGGTLELASPDGGPTTVSARIPLLLRTGESGIGGVG